MLLLIIFSLFILYIVLRLLLSLWHTDCGSKVCLVGKTALVTGGNSGIGYEIVLGLAQRGCKVIIVDKNEDDCLLENIFRETRSRNVVFKHVDLSSFKSVRKLAEDVIGDEEKLDILINNAGIGRTFSEATEDGLDMVMQVNYFGHFLLTRLLEGLLKKNGGRIIFTSSLLCYIHQFSLAGLRKSGPGLSYSFLYPNAKLCTILASDIFAENLKEYGITSNSYHPGLVATNICRSSYQHKGANINLAWFCIKGLEYCTFLFGKTAEQGAQTAIHLACSNEVANVTGQFFFGTQTTGKPKLALDKNICRAVWEATEEIVKLK